MDRQTIAPTTPAAARIAATGASVSRPVSGHASTRRPITTIRTGRLVADGSPPPVRKPIAERTSPKSVEASWIASGT